MHCFHICKVYYAAGILLGKLGERILVGKILLPDKFSNLEQTALF